MQSTLILTGDVNLKTVSDPSVPFRRIKDTLSGADVLFGNLECLLADQPAGYSLEQEGFYAGPRAGEALKLAGFDGVGCANNVTYGESAIRDSLKRLAELGIPVTGAGVDRKSARQPLIIEKAGVRYGFLQRSSIFWPRGQVAGELTPGVATIAAHTAYMPPGEGSIANRAGLAPIVVTLADERELDEYRQELADLRKQVDILVSSHHWGLAEEVLQYQRQIAHAAIDAGADIVMGHGVHYPTALEVYQEKPIFYGLGCFSFYEGHGARAFGDWIGLMPRITIEDKQVVKVACLPVRHNEQNETLLRSASEERAEMETVIELSGKLGTRLSISGDELAVWQKAMATADVRKA